MMLVSSSSVITLFSVLFLVLFFAMMFTLYISMVYMSIRCVLYTWRGPRAHVVALRHVVNGHDMPKHSGRVERLAPCEKGSLCGWLSHVVIT